MSELFRLLQEEDIKATAIIGMTKNVGKTVTFNHLVRQFMKTGIILGLVSAGYDGERFDRLTLKDKPRIYAPEDAYIATAKACFEAAEAGLELIEASSVSTPLGSVYLARVKESGLVELAGPGSISGLQELTGRMFNFGANHVLVDGAINRLASASPLLTGATVLATGASLGPTMEDVIKKTVFRRELLELPRVNDEAIYRAARKGLESGDAALLLQDGNNCYFEPVSALIPLMAGTKIIEKCKPDTTALVFGGALVDKNLQEISTLLPAPPAVIVQDATKLFISPEYYYRYLNRGGEIMVLNQLNLAAVTLNPTDPGGRGYDPKMFLERMTEALSPCPVFDLLYEEN